MRGAIGGGSVRWTSTKHEAARRLASCHRLLSQILIQRLDAAGEALAIVAAA
ncbi:MAG: hypothetical protein IRY89_16470 [Pseudolabrys sp.]|nr:hypothetical protein [Pseudolabrys sp.]